MIIWTGKNGDRLVKRKMIAEIRKWKEGKGISGLMNILQCCDEV